MSQISYIRQLSNWIEPPPNSREYIRLADRVGQFAAGSGGEHPVEQRGKRLLAVTIEPAVEKRGMRVAYHRYCGTHQRIAGVRQMQRIGPRIGGMRRTLQVAALLQQPQDLGDHHRIELSCRRDLHLRRYLATLAKAFDRIECEELYMGEAERAQRGVEMPRPGVIRMLQSIAESLLGTPRLGFGSPAPGRAAPARGNRLV